MTTMMRHSCKHCKHWYSSSVVGKRIDEDEIHEKKKKRKKDKNFKPTTRRCIITKKKIQSNSPHCKWFNPSSVYCNENNHPIKISNCLDRRRNEKQMAAWDYCKKCRQFDQEIRDIAETYWLNATPINIKTKEETRKKKKRRLKRRGESEIHKEHTTTRTIKRRKKTEDAKPKRTIKRREKRTIKRRNR
ncbi:MAG TPA: hypothetical protein VMX17_14845 [Candidatus Glassbacteria bacterium]|nr:hypothetical protein [Candidatus Glassbacteria bacterium]